MKDIRRILVSTDFSDTADLALQHAVYFAEFFAADITSVSRPDDVS